MKKYIVSQNWFWKPILIVTIASVTLTSCDPNGPEPVNTSDQFEVKNTSMSDYDEQLDEIAQALARSLSNESMRRLVKSEASKKIDGDYNILYEAIDNKLVGGRTVRQVLAAAQSDSPSARTMPVNSLTQQLPLLNIAVPVNIDKWDVSEFTPMVAVLNSKGDSQLIKAFDKDGKVHWLNAKKAPDFPVIVIGQSERYILSAIGLPELKRGLMPTDTKGANLRLEMDDYTNDPNDYPGNEPSNPSSGSGDCNNMTLLNITLTGWYSGNLSAIEAWPRGKPEIRMRAFGATTSGVKVDVYGDPVRGNLWKPNSRDDVNQRWWNLNDYLFYWNVGSYGEEVTFILHEEDGGSPTNISIPIEYKNGGITASTTITFRVDDGDDYVGYFPRRLPFCSGSTIGNETLKFKIARN